MEREIRPLTNLQDARNEYKNKGVKTLMDMITPCGMYMSMH